MHKKEGNYANKNANKMVNYANKNANKFAQNGWNQQFRVLLFSVEDFLNQVCGMRFFVAELFKDDIVMGCIQIKRKKELKHFAYNVINFWKKFFQLSFQSF